ncbi:unnamed protein product [Pleuronectes platessa]|uniref:Ig-like domain-containing protein n=1 Tax=Pleuronectes platessa TaxID=8262 RepID=A0A9N7UTI8_PLEPL|nr:unnamed protein product [Pleuronectes platessa]
MLLFILNANTQTNALQVIGGKRTVVQERTVTFNCELVDNTETVNQISWQRTTRVKKDNFFLAVRKTNGPEMKASTLASSLCSPSRSYKTHIHLDVLVPPVIRVKDNLPTLADKEVCIATCTAADSKPPANVSWLTGSLADNLRETANSTHHDDGKTTTVSYLFGVPAMDIDQQVVHCVVTSPALLKEAKIPFTIQVYFVPMEVKIGANPKEDSFQCVTDSNPKAEFNWTRFVRQKKAMRSSSGYVKKQSTKKKEGVSKVVFDKTRYSAQCSGGELLCNTRNGLRSMNDKESFDTAA